ncbi:hypothetical protein BOSP111201_23590 [Bordetella sputigena]|uniref:hypothetical protein n=1 Tax=Bordetella sputigena TaxID=1416810 RepID=UPI0039F10118
MQTKDRETLARQRLRLMQQSGVASQIAATQATDRQASVAAQRLHQQEQNKRRLEDHQNVKQMLLLMTGALQIRAGQSGAAPSTDYQGSKKLVATLVDTSPAGPIGKRHDWGGTFVTAGQLFSGAVPAAIGAAASAVAGATGIGQIETAAAVALRGAELLDATLGVAGYMGVTAPAALSAMTGSNSNLVEVCLNWWMSPAAVTAASTYLPFLQLLGALSAGATIYGKNKKLDPMLALSQRHPGTCTCNTCIDQIADGWQGGVFGVAAGLNGFAGLGMLAHDTYDKASHYARKKLAGNDTVHRDAYYIAEKLWLAAQDAVAPTHRVSRPLFVGIRTGRRCPLAMLALASLFGKGNVEAGIVKATAAIISDRVSAVDKIKRLIAD